MAITLDVYEGSGRFIPRQKYSYILCFEGIDAFLVNKISLTTEENQPSIFPYGRALSTVKASNIQDLELGDALSPNGAQMFMNVIADLTNPKQKETKKQVKLVKNYFIEMKIQTLLSNFIPQDSSPIPTQFDYSIKKIDPVGTIHEIYNFSSCYITSQKVDYNMNGDTKINLTIYSEKVVLQY